MASTPSATGTVVIASGASVSSAIEQRAMNGILITVFLPDALTNAKFHFQESLDQVTWYDIYLAKANGAASKYEINFQANAALALDPIPFYGSHYIRLAVAAPEGDSRTFKLAFYSMPAQ